MTIITVQNTEGHAKLVNPAHVAEVDVILGAESSCTVTITMVSGHTVARDFDNRFDAEVLLKDLELQGDFPWPFK